MNERKIQMRRDSINIGILLIVGICIWLGSILFSETSFVDYFRNFGDEFYRNFIYQGRFMWLLKGLKITIVISVIGVILGVLIGLVISVIRFAYQAGYKISMLNTILNVYVTVIRGTPVVVQLFILYFGVFAAFKNIGNIIPAGLALGINSGAYVAEIFRSGIESIDRGQMEAGRSLGLSYAITMKKIILPQAVKNILPTLCNEFITLIKETAIVGYIGTVDLTRASNEIRTKTFLMGPLYVSALMYLMVVLILTSVMKLLERRLKRSDQH